MAELMVNNQSLQIKEYDGQRVVTLKDIDTVHNRPLGTARKRFNDNRTRFIEGEDFYKIQKSEKRTLGFDVPNRGLILITETGYLMLVKSFTDDLAWTIQRELVNSYFKKKITIQNEFVYFDKFWNGEKVITIKDFEYFTGINQATINYYINSSLKRYEEYYLLQGTSLQQFKYLNTRYHKTVPHLILLNYNGCMKLAQVLNCNKNSIKCFKNASCMALPQKKIDRPLQIRIRQGTVAYEKLSELRDLTSSFITLLNMVGSPNIPTRLFPFIIETLQSTSVDFNSTVLDFSKAINAEIVFE